MKEHDKTQNVTNANGTYDREALPKFWFAVIVQMNTEKSSSKKLSEVGVEVYLPSQKEIHQWTDRKKIIERIVIPMIVFVRVYEKDVKYLKTLSFIKKFVSYPGEKKAAIIPDKQIDDLKFLLSNADSKVEINNEKLSVGNEVEVVRGPLCGLKGLLCNVDSKIDMVCIRIALLGYACVNISKNDIKSIS